jgi:hypothetical protein
MRRGSGLACGVVRALKVATRTPGVWGAAHPVAETAPKSSRMVRARFVIGGS